MNDKPHLPPYDVRQVALTRLLQELSNWAFRSLRIKELWGHTKGKNVRVAILDTGCNHRDISVRKFINFADDVNEDKNGHGTWVAGVGKATKGFLGISPESDLYVAKILNNDGSGDWNWMKKGLEWAHAEDCQVINISAGGDYTGTEIQPILKEMAELGRLIVCAAGNEKDLLIFPANDKHTIAVGAVNKKWEKAAFSNFGPRLIVMAPGVDLLGPWLNDGYAKVSGTSMASPIVAWILALESSIHALNLTEAIIRFFWTSKDIGSYGWDPATGTGVIEPHKFMQIEATDKKITWAWAVNLVMFLISYFVGDEENRINAKRALFGRR